MTPTNKSTAPLISKSRSKGEVQTQVKLPACVVTPMPRVARFENCQKILVHAGTGDEGKDWGPQFSQETNDSIESWQDEQRSTMY